MWFFLDKPRRWIEKRIWGVKPTPAETILEVVNPENTSIQVPEKATITAPPELHPVVERPCRKNKRYSLEPCTSESAQARSLLKKAKLTYYANLKASRPTNVPWKFRGDTSLSIYQADVLASLERNYEKKLKMEKDRNVELQKNKDKSIQFDYQRSASFKEVILFDDDDEIELNKPSEIKQVGPCDEEFVEHFSGPRGEILSENEYSQIESVFAAGKNPDDVIVSGFGVDLLRWQLHCLRDGEWLNDEVVNYFIEQMATPPQQYVWNTHFYVKLNDHRGTNEYLYSNVRRWTKRRKLDVFSLDRIIIPVHEGVHWTVALVDLVSKTIKYYDSLNMENSGCTTSLLRWIKDEWEDKKKSSYDTSDWKTEFVKNVPQQGNGIDCGVFMCMFIYHLAFNMPFDFSQEHISYFRRKMLVDILNCKENRDLS